MKKLTSLEEMSRLEDREIQAVLRELEMDDLVVALKGASPAVLDAVYRNMSQRAGTVARERGEEMGPVPLDKVEAAHKLILEAAARVLR